MYILSLIHIYIHSEVLLHLVLQFFLVGAYAPVFLQVGSQLAVACLVLITFLEQEMCIRDSIHFILRVASEILVNIDTLCPPFVVETATLLDVNGDQSDHCLLYTSDIMRRERRRVIFGLSPITRIKVVSNRARVRLRSWLKSKGYIAGEEYGILYYTDDLHRIQESELRGAKLGFRFLPYPSEETIVLSNLL